MSVAGSRLRSVLKIVALLLLLAAIIAPIVSSNVMVSIRAEVMMRSARISKSISLSMKPCTMISMRRSFGSGAVTVGRFPDVGVAHYPCCYPPTVPSAEQLVKSQRTGSEEHRGVVDERVPVGV